MKMKNIPPNIKSKSIKEAKDEINDILSKLEKNDAVLEDYNKDYQKLIKLNAYIDSLYKDELKKISNSKKLLKRKRLKKWLQKENYF